ncbi:MAG: DUF1934 family protein [Coprobacillaceae bacterium]
MKKTINIKYNSIFKYETHKETIQYKEIGTYEKTNKGTFIKFSSKETKIQIRMHQDTVWLMNNQSELQLVKGKRIKNKYATMYGDINIDTYMETFEDNGNIKIKYQLLDQNSCISEVYILIHIQNMELEDENT